jgi:hypothetical protein
MTILRTARKGDTWKIQKNNTKITNQNLQISERQTDIHNPIFKVFNKHFKETYNLASFPTSCYNPLSSQSPLPIQYNISTLQNALIWPNIHTATVL